MNQNESDEKQTVFALDIFREKVLTALLDAHANNDLEMDEYEKRLDIAFGAKSIEELEHAVFDFPQVKTLFQSTDVPPRTISPSPGFEPSRPRHPGSRKWFPIQIGLIPPFMLVDSDYSIYGIRMGFILSENIDVFGLDFGFILRVRDRLFGLQFAFINSANYVKGIQFGFVNHAEKVHGLQFGFINNTKVLSGAQFGFLNISQSRDGKEKYLPLINLGF